MSACQEWSHVDRKVDGFVVDGAVASRVSSGAAIGVVLFIFLVLAAHAHAAAVGFLTETLESTCKRSEPIERIQYFTTNGDEYCWYDDGWNGPGWYCCGDEWIAGYGWGGGYGWNGWGGGAYTRRYGFHGVGVWHPGPPHVLGGVPLGPGHGFSQGPGQTGGQQGWRNFGGGAPGFHGYGGGGFQGLWAACRRSVAQLWIPSGRVRLLPRGRSVRWRSWRRRSSMIARHLGDKNRATHQRPCGGRLSLLTAASACDRPRGRLPFGTYRRLHSDRVVAGAAEGCV